MYVVIRQGGKPFVVLSTRATRRLTERDIARVKASHLFGVLEVGYYDIVLTSRPADARYDVDSVIEVA